MTPAELEVVKVLLESVSEEEAISLVQILMQHISLEEQSITGIGYINEDEV